VEAGAAAEVDPLALAFRPLVVVAGAEELPVDEAADELAALLLDEAAEELLLLLDEEASLEEEPAEEALPFKQELSLLAWMGTWLE